MDQRFKPGELVMVNMYGGEGVRRVVEDRGDVVIICNEETYRRSQAEGVTANGIGFRHWDVKPVGPTRIEGESDGA